MNFDKKTILILSCCLALIVSILGYNYYAQKISMKTSQKIEQTNYDIDSGYGEDNNVNELTSEKTQTTDGKNIKEASNKNSEGKIAANSQNASTASTKATKTLKKRSYSSKLPIASSDSNSKRVKDIKDELNSQPILEGFAETSNSVPVTKTYKYGLKNKVYFQGVWYDIKVVSNKTDAEPTESTNDKGEDTSL